MFMLESSTDLTTDLRVRERNRHRRLKVRREIQLARWIKRDALSAPVWWQRSLLSRISAERPFYGKMPLLLQKTYGHETQDIKVMEDGSILCIRYDDHEKGAYQVCRHVVASTLETNEFPPAPFV